MSFAVAALRVNAAMADEVEALPELGEAHGSQA